MAQLRIQQRQEQRALAVLDLLAEALVARHLAHLQPLFHRPAGAVAQVPLRTGDPRHRQAHRAKREAVMPLRPGDGPRIVHHEPAQRTVGGRGEAAIVNCVIVGMNDRDQRTDRSRHQQRLRHQHPRVELVAHIRRLRDERAGAPDHCVNWACAHKSRNAMNSDRAAQSRPRGASALGATPASHSLTRPRALPPRTASGGHTAIAACRCSTTDRVKDGFLAHLTSAASKLGVSTYAWTIMPEHVHLVLRIRRHERRAGRPGLSDPPLTLFDRNQERRVGDPAYAADEARRRRTSGNAAAATTAT
jgi:hypothetical protein